MRLVAVFLLLTACSCTSSLLGLSSGTFLGFQDIKQIQCSGASLPQDADVMFVLLYEVTSRKILATMNVNKKECTTSEDYVSCDVVDGDSRKSSLSALISDLAEGQSRVYGCNLTALMSRSSVQTFSWSITVQHIPRTTTTSTPTTTTSTTTTLKPPPPGEAPIASGVKSNVQEFQLPISVVIIGLVLLLFFAILCAILVILQCRGKRRRRSRAANRESLLSTKSEPVGGDGGYRTTRSITGYPPGQMPPETPGGNFAMRYQKSIPDTGYVSGSSVYYSEPYGTLDEEMKERLRPNPRMCHIPYDLKGGPLDTHPQEHSA